MKRLTGLTIFVLFGLLTLQCTTSFADEYAATKTMFVDAGVGKMFNQAYGYALFPTIGKAGFVVGGAYGEGKVYEHGAVVGKTTMTQASIGFQLGASGFSQVIFFQDKRAFDEFTQGNFEFSAEVQGVALTAAASASTSTSGSSATASGGKNNAQIAKAGYYKGMMTFTITKGGLMAEASVSGQKFTFTAN
ncbi:MAG: YSC84-related protein [Desulfopila sp.]